VLKGLRVEIQKSSFFCNKIRGKYNLNQNSFWRKSYALRSIELKFNLEIHFRKKRFIFHPLTAIPAHFPEFNGNVSCIPSCCKNLI
jgi:hypothetical protein